MAESVKLAAHQKCSEIRYETVIAFIYCIVFLYCVFLCVLSSWKLMAHPSSVRQQAVVAGASWALLLSSLEQRLPLPSASLDN